MPARQAVVANILLEFDLQPLQAMLK